MRYHFNIFFPGKFEQVSNWLRQQAAVNSLLALGQGVGDNFVVVVAPTAELAKWQQEQLDDGTTVSPSLCPIEVIPEFSLIRISLECGDAAREATDILIRDLLNRFPDYAVYDEDKDQVITDLVRADAGVLFDA